MSGEPRKRARTSDRAQTKPKLKSTRAPAAAELKPARESAVAAVATSVAPRRPSAALARSSVALHGVLLAASAAFATYVYTREAEPKARGDVVVWQGKADSVSRIEYASKSRKVSLEAKQDAAGRYYSGVLEKETKAKPPPDPTKPHDPHGHDGEAEDGHDHDPSEDAHEEGDAAADAKKPEAPEKIEKVTTTLLSVGNAKKLAEALAPLRAKRALGRVDEGRLADFGLTEPEAKLTVVVGNAERKLTIGGPTPGGSDRYVRDDASGEVYAIDGEVVRDLESADSRLVERELHDWESTEVARATVSAGDRKREVVRGGESPKRFWADADKPSEADETIANWMSKLERLRPSEYPKEPPQNAELVVRVDYSGAGGKLGFIELHKVKPAGEGKPDYFVISERTRRLAKVPASTAEQAETDVNSILR